MMEGFPKPDALYLQWLWRPELAYLTAADYLARRDTFFALCKLCPLEHPVLGQVRDRMRKDGKSKITVPSFCSLPFGAFDLFGFDRYEIFSALGGDRLLMDTYFKARSDILGVVYRDFDVLKLGLGFRSGSSGGPSDTDLEFRPKVLATTTHKTFTAFSTAWAERTGKPACFAYGRMYRAPEVDALEYPSRLREKAGQPLRKGGAGCSVYPLSRINALESACASLSPTEMPDVERPERAEAALDGLTLTWETLRLSDLDEWEAACREIDGWFGKTMTAASTDDSVDWFAAKGVAFSIGRYRAMDLMWEEPGTRGKKTWHLNEGWKTRIKILQQIRAEQKKMGLLV